MKSFNNKETLKIILLYNNYNIFCSLHNIGYIAYMETYKKSAFFVTVEPLSTTNISSTYPPGSNYMSKCAGDLREKTHEV